MNKIDLNDKRAVITGGGRGMGFAIAARFLQSGASVSLWDINPDVLDKAVNALKEQGQVDSQVVDVSDYASVKSSAENTAKALGGIDLLVNCAGIAGVNAPVVDYPLDTWTQVQRVNLDGVFHTCRAIVPYMLSKIPMARMGQVEEIAAMVAWMSSEECSYTTGANTKPSAPALKQSVISKPPLPFSTVILLATVST